MENLEQDLTSTLNVAAGGAHEGGHAGEEKLRSAEKYLCKLSEPHYEDIYRVDSLGRCTFASRFVARVLGCRPDYLFDQEDTPSLIHYNHMDESSCYPKGARLVDRAFEEKGSR